MTPPPINMTDEINRRFEHYWQLLGRTTADTFIRCQIVPREESFKRMLEAAYSMGWVEGRTSTRGDYPSVEEIEFTEGEGLAGAEGGA
jgi:hypothetical protein